jgi:hypothetical protein
MRVGSFVLNVVVTCAMTLGTGRARANTPSDGRDSPDARASLDAAKELFRRGVALYEAGDIERALDLFLRSRAEYRSSQNTIDAALCLERLGHYDEALAMYEDALTFAGKLDDGDRVRIARATAALLPKLSTLEISSNVPGGVVTVDGRARGTLPLSSPIRVVAGRRRVRVLAPGYTTYERDVDAAAGVTMKLDAALAPLVHAGLVRIEDPTLEGAEVFVDGAAVGSAPWEGTLAVGKHTVWTAKGAMGSPPTPVVVVSGQLAVLRVRAARLGALVRIAVTPPTATLAIDGAEMPFATWEGRLPIGAHRLFAIAPGYLARETDVVVPGAGAPAVRAELRLEREPSSRGEIVVAALLGYEVESFLSGDSSLSPPLAGTPMKGYIAGLRVGYRLPIGVSLEAGGGIYRVTSATTSDGHTPATWLVEAPFGEFGASYRVRLGGANAALAAVQVALVPRVTAGMLFTKRTLTDVGGHSSEHTARQLPFVAPEIGIELRAPRAHVSVTSSFALRLITETVTWSPQVGAALSF